MDMDRVVRVGSSHVKLMDIPRFDLRTLILIRDFTPFLTPSNTILCIDKGARGAPCTLSTGVDFHLQIPRKC
jgi:hypothetical protein